jgi:hypothetical protein
LPVDRFVQRRSFLNPDTEVFCVTGKRRNACHVGEVFEMLHCKRHAESGVVCASCKNPSRGGDTQIRPWPPDGSGYGQPNERSKRLVLRTSSTIQQLRDFGSHEVHLTIASLMRGHTAFIALVELAAGMNIADDAILVQ